ncbi:hypothetical protein [Nonomuraea angiospora]
MEVPVDGAGRVSFARAGDTEPGSPFHSYWQADLLCTSVSILGHHHPYIQHTIRRMGDLVLNLAPPEKAPTTRLDLEPCVLFAQRL